MICRVAAGSIKSGEVKVIWDSSQGASFRAGVAAPS